MVAGAAGFQSWHFEPEARSREGQARGGQGCSAPYFLNPLKQCEQVGTTYLNTQSYGEGLLIIAIITGRVAVLKARDGHM